MKALWGKREWLFSTAGEPLFKGDGLTAEVFDDPWGSWGGMVEEPDSIHLTNIREVWKITEVTLLESGPERADALGSAGGRKIAHRSLLFGEP